MDVFFLVLFINLFKTKYERAVISLQLILDHKKIFFIKFTTFKD